MQPNPFESSRPRTHFLHLQFSSAVSIANDTITVVTWNKIVSAVGGFSLIDTGRQIVVPKPGVYSIVYTGQWDTGATGIRLNQLVSGNLGALLAARVNGASADFPNWFLPFMVLLKAGDTLWGNAYQSSGGNLSILGTDTAANGFVIKLIEEL